MLLLPTTLIQTARAVTVGGATPPASLYLTGVPARVEPVKATQLVVLPDASLLVQMLVTVETGTDIVPGDLITSVTLMDGATPWASGPGTNRIWEVRYVLESTPGYLAVRQCFVGIVIIGGLAGA